jgi:hypothetical protein
MKTIGLVAVVLLACGELFAQSGVGAIGDPAIAPGNPRTSYALSGIDHLNYYSGSVNFTIPLTTIGGRGLLPKNSTKTRYDLNVLERTDEEEAVHGRADGQCSQATGRWTHSRGHWA